jgi:polysaccharide export outer membrane protein
MVAALLSAWQVRADIPGASPGVSGDYVLQPGDTIKVQVFQEPDLDRELLVSADGEVFLPLIGTLVVKGQTVKTVSETVRSLYDSKYLVNPQVNISVIKYRERTVNVIGAVNEPQAIPFPPEQPLKLLDAISRAGGFNRYANRKAVQLTRTFPDGHTEKYSIDADDVLSGKGDIWVLQSGDVIFVPESIL